MQDTSIIINEISFLNRKKRNPQKKFWSEWDQARLEGLENGDILIRSYSPKNSEFRNLLHFLNKCPTVNATVNALHFMICSNDWFEFRPDQVAQWNTVLDAIQVLGWDPAIVSEFRNKIEV